MAYFGASNQMLAALTLMILTLYFWQRGKPILPLLIPMLFIMTITLISLFIKAGEFYHTTLYLFVLNVILILLICWMMVEGVLSVINRKKAK